VINKLTEDFYKSVGQSKSLKYLNLGLETDNVSTVSASLIAKAVSMNKRSKGGLEALVLKNWFTSN